MSSAEDGLLIVGDQRVSPQAPEGGAMAVLTTYGLDDTGFKELRLRWEAWWLERYSSPPMSTA